MRINTLEIKIENKEEIEIALLIINLGILTAIKGDLLSLDKAEGILYNPYTFRKMKEIGVKKEILDIIYEGWELDALKILDLEGYKAVVNKKIKKIRELLKKHHFNTKLSNNNCKWIK